MGQLYRDKKDLPAPLHTLDSQIYKWYSNQSNGSCPLTSFLSNKDRSKDQVSQHILSRSRKQKATAWDGKRMDKKLLLHCTSCSSQEVTTASVPHHCKMVLDLDSPGHQEKTEINYNQHPSSLEEQENRRLSRSCKSEIMCCYCFYSIFMQGWKCLTCEKMHSTDLMVRTKGPATKKQERNWAIVNTC